MFAQEQHGVQGVPKQALRFYSLRPRSGSSTRPWVLRLCSGPWGSRRAASNGKLVHGLSSPHILPSLKQWQSPAGDPERAENLTWQEQQNFVDGRSKRRQSSPVCSHCASIESPRKRGFWASLSKSLITHGKKSSFAVRI